MFRSFFLSRRWALWAWGGLFVLVALVFGGMFATLAGRLVQLNVRQDDLATIGRLTAQDLGLSVQLYDPKAYHQAVRNLWVGTGDYSDVAARRSAATTPTVPEAPARGTQ